MENEELVTLIKANKNVKENMKTLWQQNQGFIRSVVSGYREYEEFDDLMQQAYFGLHTAACNYVPECGVKFLSYAGAVIKTEIREYIEKCSKIIRIPRSMLSIRRKYAKILEYMQKEHGRKPDDAELCGLMGITGQQLQLIRHSFIFDNMKSLDTPAGNDEDNDILLSDCISGEQDIEHEVTERIRAQELGRTLNAMLGELTDEQREILRLHYFKNMTMTEIEKMRNMKAGTARLVKDKALRKLEKPHRKKKLEPFIEEYITTHAMSGVGVSVFNRTWTSATEKTALKVADWQQSHAKITKSAAT